MLPRWAALSNPSHYVSGARGVDGEVFRDGRHGLHRGRVARQLVAAGHDVVAIARNPESARDLESIGVDVRRGDITDPDSLRGLMAGVDGVFHIAGWYKIGSRDPSEGERLNLAGTRNVLTAMKELRVPKGVYTSTLAVFSDTHGRLVDETYRHNGRWLTEYDWTKWIAYYEIAEPMIRAGLPLVIVQPGVNYGPGDTSEIRPTRAVPPGRSSSHPETDRVLLGPHRGYGARASSRWNEGGSARRTSSRVRPTR